MLWMRTGAIHAGRAIAVHVQPLDWHSCAVTLNQHTLGSLDCPLQQDELYAQALLLRAVCRKWSEFLAIVLYLTWQPASAKA